MSFNLPSCMVCRDTGTVQKFIPGNFRPGHFHEAYVDTGEPCPRCNGVEFDTEYQDLPKCPSCGHEDRDYFETLELDRDEGEASCPACGDRYEYEIHRDICFTTRKKSDHDQKGKRPRAQRA